MKIVLMSYCSNNHAYLSNNEKNLNCGNEEPFELCLASNMRLRSLGGTGFESRGSLVFSQTLFL